MRRNTHPFCSAASVFLLLLMVSLQAGKLFHASRHAANRNSAPVEKHHGAGFAQTTCLACEFEYCHEALPANAIMLKEIAVHAASAIVPSIVTVSHLRFVDADWRGPPFC